MTDIIERARALRAKIEGMATSLPDTDAEQYPELYPKWDASAKYVKGERVRYGDTLYKVLQDHTAQDTWDPADAPSLWAKVLTSDDGTPKEWVQPDSTNAYKKGDKVLYQGKTYESLIDTNVWSPSAYPAGWKEV